MEAGSVDSRSEGGWPAPGLPKAIRRLLSLWLLCSALPAAAPWLCSLGGPELTALVPSSSALSTWLLLASLVPFAIPLLPRGESPVLAAALLCFTGAPGLIAAYALAPGRPELPAALLVILTTLAAVALITSRVEDEGRVWLAGAGALVGGLLPLMSLVAETLGVDFSWPGLLSPGLLALSLAGGASVLTGLIPAGFLLLLFAPLFRPKLVGAVLVFLCLGWASPALAGELRVIAADPLLAGQARPGRPYPLRLRLGSDGAGPWCGRVLVRMGAVTVSMPVLVPGGSLEAPISVVLAPIPFGRERPTIELEREGQPARLAPFDLAPPRLIEPSRRLVAVLGSQDGVELPAALIGAVRIPLRPELVPLLATGGEAIDAIQAGSLSEPRQVRALRAWTAQGGILLLSRRADLALVLGREPGHQAGLIELGAGCLCVLDGSLKAATLKRLSRRLAGADGARLSERALLSFLAAAPRASRPAVLRWVGLGSLIVGLALALLLASESFGVAAQRSPGGALLPSAVASAAAVVILALTVLPSAPVTARRWLLDMGSGDGMLARTELLELEPLRLGERVELGLGGPSSLRPAEGYDEEGGGIALNSEGESRGQQLRYESTGRRVMLRRDLVAAQGLGLDWDQEELRVRGALGLVRALWVEGGARDAVWRRVVDGRVGPALAAPPAAWIATVCEALPPGSWLLIERPSVGAALDGAQPAGASRLVALRRPVRRGSAPRRP